MKLTESDLDARRLASSAAPSWYVLAAAKDLKRAPIGLRGRGEELVVWRGRSGRPIAIDRHCPHHGADLALGEVRDGTLRCAFHGWRFDDQGRCSFLPGEERIPGSAHRRVRQLREKYGLVWIWSGTDEPLFPLPVIPELERSSGEPPYVHSFRHDIGGTPVSRVHENAVDTIHLAELHKLSLRSIDIEVLDKPRWDVDDPRRPAHADVGAWYGSVLEFELNHGDHVERIARLLGVPLGRIRIVIDKWPSGTIARMHSDDVHRNTVVITASPYGRDSGSLYGISITPKHGRTVRDLLSHALISTKNHRVPLQDIPLWRTLGSSYDGVLVRSDAPIMAYRRWYASWVKASLGNVEHARS
ncbi:MAG TPA: Rieske 2Fe-2S domain-containing protein [Pseudonocardiaceae bacterium]|nr:Rieske 2Fe-2S domain-containing protein [Pseudonocardiaceae bacterium]